MCYYYANCIFSITIIGSNATKIFISHQNKDNKFVSKLTQLLDKYDIRYWVDIEQIYDKISDIDQEIRTGLKESTHFLLIWSCNSKESIWVQREIKQALSKPQMTRFSFRLDETEFEGDSKKFADYDYLKVKIDELEEKIRDFIFNKIMKDLGFKSQIRVFKDKVRYDFEHQQKYIENEAGLSVKSFKKFDTFNEFVSQNCILSKTLEEKDILGYVTNLLVKGISQKFIPITGDYGSGKSLLSLYVLYNLSKELDDNLIPLYIPLGSLRKYNHTLELNFIDSIFKYISKEYNISKKQSFYSQVDEGNLIFILDALDEMATKIDPSIIDTNIAKIKELVEKGNRVMLTSRRTYLSKFHEAYFIKDHDLILISDFNSDKIKQFVTKKINNGKIKINKTIFLKDLDDPALNEFTKKPLFLQIICEKYDEIRNSSVVNPASIFGILTDEWIRHDVYKRNLSSSETSKLIESRQRISESLAFRTNKYTYQGAISLQEIKEQIEEEFSLEKGYQISDEQLSEFYKDAKDSTFLIREKSDGVTDSYSFIHNAVIEYLIARRIVSFIKENIYGSKTEMIIRYLQEIRSHEIFEFIDYITDIEWAIKPHIVKELSSGLKQEKIQLINNKSNRLDIVYQLIEEIKNRSNDRDPENNTDIGNLISMLYSISDFAKFSFKKTTKHYTNQNLSFSNCNLDGVRLPYANLAGATFTNANLSNANLSNANLSNADFSGTVLYYANLSGANLSGANLSKAKLIETKLNNANLSGANLSYVNTTLENDFASYDGRYYADLCNADLSGVNITNADLSYCFIINPISFKDMRGNKKLILPVQ